MGLDGGPHYRTGDLARVRADGNVEFLGRVDAQPKLNGVRVETIDVENAIRAHDRVLDCAVAVSDIGHPPRAALVAYVVPRDQGLTEGDLRNYCAQTVPAAMAQPAAFVLLSDMPTLPNGKCAHHDLPAPQHLPRTSPRPYRPPRTAVEAALVQIWYDVLKVSPIGVDDDFYDLGGDSLLAADVIASIAANISPTIMEPEIESMPTIAETAALLGLDKCAGHTCTSGCPECAAPM